MLRELQLFFLVLRVFITGAVIRRCSVKKPEACTFIKKEALAQVFSCEFSEICKNTYGGYFCN